MKGLIALIPFMVCLIFTMILLSCVKKEDVTEPDTGYAISGTVKYWRDQSAASGITVELRSAYAETTCVTDSAGSYCFAGLKDHVYRIVPIETNGAYYYFEPESTEVVISGEDITVTTPGADLVISGEDITLSRFLALGYPEVVLENNGPWKIIGVKARRIKAPASDVNSIVFYPVAMYIDRSIISVGTKDNIDNLLAKDLEPFTCSEKVRIKPGYWNFIVTSSNGLTGLKAKDNTIRGICVRPEELHVLPLNSVLKVRNNSSSFKIKSVEFGSCDSTWSSWGRTQRWSGNLLKKEVFPGSFSEDIYIWPGCQNVILGYSENSYSSSAMQTDISFSPGDTVYLTFEK